MKTNSEQNFLKKGKKIKVGGEDFVVENFKDEDNFDGELGNGTRTKEMILRNQDTNNPKMFRQKFFISKNENCQKRGILRETKNL